MHWTLRLKDLMKGRAAAASEGELLQQMVKARIVVASSKHLALASAAARDGGIVDLKIAKG
jgi:hypothetical protein